jgi:hypothetical protein
MRSGARNLRCARRKASAARGRAITPTRLRIARDLSIRGLDTPRAGSRAAGSALARSASPRSRPGPNDDATPSLPLSTKKEASPPAATLRPQGRSALVCAPTRQTLPVLARLILRHGQAQDARESVRSRSSRRAWTGRLLRGRRFREARQLLPGFADQSHLCRVVRDETGRTPTALPPCVARCSTRAAPGEVCRRPASCAIAVCPA